MPNISGTSYSMQQALKYIFSLSKSIVKSPPDICTIALSAQQLRY